MATEYDQILMARQKAKRSVIANMIGFGVGVLVTVLTYLSPSPVFLIAWARPSYARFLLREVTPNTRLKAMIPYGGIMSTS